jgi:SAM-dependent methyltransferase
MNAEDLRFEDNTFDCVLSFNTFEHFLRPPVVLSEIHRVLKPGGSVVICFEGMWSSSFGYHLLQFGEQIDHLIPPWGHLFLSEAQMAEALGERWPKDAPISLSEAVAWIYHSDELNRLGIHDLKIYFETSALSLEWVLPLVDIRAKELGPIADYVSTFVPYSAQELLTRGLSVHLKKK